MYHRVTSQCNSLSLSPQAKNQQGKKTKEHMTCTICSVRKVPSAVRDVMHSVPRTNMRRTCTHGLHTQTSFLVFAQLRILASTDGGRVPNARPQVDSPP